jgi:hypothetical protein
MMPQLAADLVPLKPVSAAAKVLFLDVEVSPNLAYVWGKYEQNTLGDFLQERQVICFAWNWLGEEKIHVLSMRSFGSYKRDRQYNGGLVRALHKLISQADVVVAHNLKKYDEKVTNTEFLVHGLQPPPPHKMIDTLEVLRAKFQLNSNKLDDACARLGIGRKVDTGGFSLWVRCLEGDLRAWAKMERYNVGDIRLLKKLYLVERPWITNHPNLGLIAGSSGCPNCRSKNLRPKGYAYTRVAKTARFVCRDCGHWCQGRPLKSGGWRFS